MSRPTLVGAFLVLAVISAVVPLNGYAYKVADSKFALDVDGDTAIPAGVTKLFLTSDARVYFWVNLTDVERALALKFDFYSPSGVLYDTVNLVVEAPPPGNIWIWYVAYAWISVEGSDPETSPGQWVVRFYVDNSLQVTGQFDIVTRQTLIERLAALESQIASLSQSLPDLQTRYNALLQDFNTVKAQLEAAQQTVQKLNATLTPLQGQVKTLTSALDAEKKDAADLRLTNTKLQADVASRQTQYNAAVKDVDSLKGQVATASTLQYVFIGTTAVFALLTVLVWRRKGGQAAVRVPSSGAEIPRAVEPTPLLQTKVCPNCKNEIPMDVKFCPVCGVPQA